MYFILIFSDSLNNASLKHGGLLIRIQFDLISEDSVVPYI